MSKQDRKTYKKSEKKKEWDKKSEEKKDRDKKNRKRYWVVQSADLDVIVQAKSADEAIRVGFKAAAVNREKIAIGRAVRVIEARTVDWSYADSEQIVKDLGLEASEASIEDDTPQTGSVPSVGGSVDIELATPTPAVTT